MNYFLLALLPWHKLAEEHPEQPQPQLLSPFLAFFTCFPITNAMKPNIIVANIIVVTINITPHFKN